jgi:hypothetical protein
MKAQLSRHSYEKYSNIKFHENLSIGSQVVACGLKNRRDEANSRFSDFSNAPKPGKETVHIIKN